MITVFDIETGPLPRDQLDRLIEPYPPYLPPGPFDEKSVKLGNTKDPAKIKEKIDAARHKHAELVAGAEDKYAADKLEYEQAIIGRAALNAHHGRVLAIGLYHTTDGFWVVADDDEREILRAFWTAFDLAHVSKWKMIGFNIFGFDLPFLIRRSWLVGVPVNAAVMDRDRYWNPIFVDLMARWQCGNRQDSISLNAACRAFGVGEKNGHGADFARLWESDRAAAVAYLERDIELTYQLSLRMGVK